MATHTDLGTKSMDTIPKSLDNALDKANPSNGHVKPGISIRNGPVVEMEIDTPVTNGAQTNGVLTGKRKSRSSLANGNVKSYREASDDDEDDEPLVSFAH